MREISIIEALQDANLLAGFIKPASWASWFALFRSMFALPPEDGDLAIFQQATGRQAWPSMPAKEVYVIAGRRSGKSHNVALLGTFMAAFREYDLAKGERAVIAIISPTTKQGRIIRRYIESPFRENPFLSAMIERETTSELDLSNHVSIEVLAADQRAVRGYSSPCVLLDECAFFSSEANRSDIEVIRAWRPALATLRGILVAISSPYSKVGHLYNMWKLYYGKDGDVLIWQAPSRLMNPTLDQEVIDRAMLEDPEASQSEWQAQWRQDIESYVSREAVEACVVPGRYELPYISGTVYRAFVDPSGGRADSMTLAIAHKDGDVFVLDAVRDVRPPFSPDQVVDDFASFLRTYGIAVVRGDRYAGSWCEERFTQHGIQYQVAEKAKSDLYKEMLPAINSGRLELLENATLVNQIVNLERRTTRGGRDSIDHGPGGHDDVANAVAGVVYELQRRSDLLFPFL